MHNFGKPFIGLYEDTFQVSYPYDFTRYLSLIWDSFCETTRGRNNQIRLQKSSEAIVQHITLGGRSQTTFTRFGFF